MLVRIPSYHFRSFCYLRGTLTVMLRFAAPIRQIFTFLGTLEILVQLFVASFFNQLPVIPSSTLSKVLPFEHHTIY